jgi:hypothetical protein
MYEVGKAATSATSLVIRNLTRYISATQVATIRYVSVNAIVGYGLSNTLGEILNLIYQTADNARTIISDDARRCEIPFGKRGFQIIRRQ